MGMKPTSTRTARGFPERRHVEVRSAEVPPCQAAPKRPPRGGAALSHISEKCAAGTAVEPQDSALVGFASRFCSFGGAS